MVDSSLSAPGCPPAGRTRGSGGVCAGLRQSRDPKFLLKLVAASPTPLQAHVDTSRVSGPADGSAPPRPSATSFVCRAGPLSKQRVMHPGTGDE